MAFCSNCGNKLEPGALFCDNCGFKVEAPEPAAPQRPADPAPAAPHQPARPAAPVQQPCPAAPAKKKTPVALIIVIVIVALALVGGIVTAAVLLLPKFIGGGSKNGDAGYYQFLSITENGTTFTAEDMKGMGVAPDSIYLLMNEDGTGTLCFEDTDPFTWADGKITAANGDQLSYTRDGDEITINVDGDIMVFSRSDATAPTPVYTSYKYVDSNPANWTSNISKKWNGVWYGSFCVSSGTGKYKSYINSTYDAYTLIYSDSNGDAVFSSYIDGSSLPYLAATAKADEYYFTIGTGMLFDQSLEAVDYAHVILSQSMGNAYAMLSGSYTDFDGDTLEFTVYMKPYGEDWSDVIGTDTLPVPPGYDDYINNINNGYDAPYTLDQLKPESESMS